MQPAGLDEELARLAAMSSAQLRARWSEFTGRPVPRVSPAMLRLALAWELQASSYGGLSRKTKQKLEQIAAAKTDTRDIRPGMRLVREWNGKLHIVTAAEDGSILWEGKTWPSLSKVAREITGTRWSGPAFFGLKTRKDAA